MPPERMALKFLETVLTPSVRAAEARFYGVQRKLPPAPERDKLTEYEISFIAARDSFYLATVSESGWPYVQHRGGPPGFIHILDEKTLAIPDFRGNRQYISAG